ncbi:hypothetical protein E2C01_041477 [Portunus trituberculatus]|uniref:RNase H type-1 domain-containing protein n=1 Tax=Portunus trituberculatus TaxID=210409 RepID=A0A5B7FMQ5_PORTR|nr:hypothetical protein [Portunus trituberculatus]
MFDEIAATLQELFASMQGIVRATLSLLFKPFRPHRCQVQQILHQLVSAHDSSLNIQFVWIPSHVGITANDKVDLAKDACRLPLPDGATPSLCYLLKMVQVAALHSTHHRMEAERPHSVSIQHYDHFRLSPPKYHRHGLMVQRHNIVSERLQLGYRPVWQVSEAGDIPNFSNCKLCEAPNTNSLHHYCLHCPSEGAISGGKIYSGYATTMEENV